MKSKISKGGLTSVRIRPDIVQKIIPYVRGGVSKSEIINEALRQYLIDRELQAIRAQLIPHAQAKGVYTDEDVERLLK